MTSASSGLKAIRGGKTPPPATADDPFAQVRWAFNKRASLVPSEEGKENYYSAYAFLAQHLKDSRGERPYVIADEWDEFILLSLRDEILDRVDAGVLRLSSSTLVGHFSSVRGTVENAASIGALRTRTIQAVGFGNAYPETDAHTAYTQLELEQLVEVLENELAFCQAVAKPPLIPASTLGMDPRLRKRVKGWGYKPEPNMRWYFVNVLKCMPVVGAGKDKELHDGFLRSATNNHGGLHELYRSWGVSAFIDENVMMPLVTWMNYLTGLNPSSVLNLKVDSYREAHPLTNLPYIALDKPRAGGELELHLPLLDGTPTLPLKGKHSVWVRRVFELILKLTEKLRDSLPPDDERRLHLFLYQATGPQFWMEVRCLNDRMSSSWRKKMTKKYGLKKADGTPMTFNHVRFRSTMLTRMVLAGRDLLAVKSVGMQKNIRTTLGYVSTRQVDEGGRHVVVKALTNIRTNRQKFEPVKKGRSRCKVIPIRVHKGLVSDCLNVFDPPDNVRQTKSFKEGGSCTRFNMCLLCSNVVVMRKHLPLLVSYRNQIRAADITEVPSESVYTATLDVLENILNPSFGEFSAGDIKWAEEQAMYMDVVIDPLVYKKVLQ